MPSPCFTDLVDKGITLSLHQSHAYSLVRFRIAFKGNTETSIVDQKFEYTSTFTFDAKLGLNKNCITRH